MYTISQKPVSIIEEILGQCLIIFGLFCCMYPGGKMFLIHWRRQTLTIVSPLYGSSFKGLILQQLSSWKFWGYMEKSTEKAWVVFFGGFSLFFFPGSFSHILYCVPLIQTLQNLNVNLIGVTFHGVPWCDLTVMWTSISPTERAVSFLACVDAVVLGRPDVEVVVALRKAGPLGHAHLVNRSFGLSSVSFVKAAKCCLTGAPLGWRAVLPVLFETWR